MIAMEWSTRVASSKRFVQVPGTMTTEDAEQGPRRKHRHDLGHEDHGSKLAAGTTKAIQTILGLWIVISCGLAVYALVDATRSRPAVTETSH